MKLFDLIDKLEELKIDNQQGWGAVPDNRNVDYKGLRVQIKPSKFLELAHALDTPYSALDIEKHIKSNGAIGAPFLLIAIPQDWFEGDLSLPAEIYGHEGRNRMTAIHRVEGDIPVETHLFFGSGLRNRDLTPEIISRLNKDVISQRGNLIKGPWFVTDMQPSKMQEYRSYLENITRNVDEAVKQRLDRKCWTGYKKKGTKIKNGVRVNNCVAKENIVYNKNNIVENNETNAELQSKLRKVFINVLDAFEKKRPYDALDWLNEGGWTINDSPAIKSLFDNNMQQLGNMVIVELTQGDADASVISSLRRYIEQVGIDIPNDEIANYLYNSLYKIIKALRLLVSDDDIFGAVKTAAELEKWGLDIQIDDFVDFEDQTTKKQFIKKMLIYMKRGEYNYVRSIVKFLRNNDINWTELEAFEKSLAVL